MQRVNTSGTRHRLFVLADGRNNITSAPLMAAKTGATLTITKLLKVQAPALISANWPRMQQHDSHKAQLSIVFVHMHVV